MKSDLLKIKSIAKDIYKSLGSGYPEVVYDKAMQVGLRLASYKYDNQKVVELTYKDHYVGEGCPDIVVKIGKEKIIIELKAVAGQLGSAEEQQLRNYMNLLKAKYGLLINFQQPNKKGAVLEIKEI